ncbi:MAG: hypothetical protein QOI92_395, partial [Chloroflexota bacterium]|nr:hypothetical protein [Chloroflexota bacterium]
ARRVRGKAAAARGSRAAARPRPGATSVNGPVVPSRPDSSEVWPRVDSSKLWPKWPEFPGSDTPNRFIAQGNWWRWGRVELPVQNPSPVSTTSVSDHFRQPQGRRSAPCPGVQSRVSRSSLLPDYATLIRFATPLHDASTAREVEAASTLTLRPKPRERESTACWQVLRFAAGLTRPDSTSARVR